MIESVGLKRCTHHASLILLASLLIAFTLLESLCAPNIHAQSAPVPTVTGLPSVDSLAAMEFAKDSLGSITIGVISGSQLAWTHSYGFADMKTHRLATRSTVYQSARSQSRSPPSC